MSEMSAADGTKLANLIAGAWCFSGAILGLVAGTSTAYLAGLGASATSAVLAAAQGFPAPSGSRVARNLRVRCPINPLLSALTATLYVNGVATALTVSVTAGSTALFKDTTHTVALTADDLIDLRLDNVNGGAAVATVVATMELL